ncbi:MAG: TMEM175 family protein [Chthoniobacterales bacterium]
MTELGKRERFTSRLEAFSDLVFGFSLSLLATRLDVPARVEDIFDPARWLTVIVTFALVCRFWLEHYRTFRHGFIAEIFDVVVNFIFLFAIAILPYSLQTFLRFPKFLPSFALYMGDFSLILLSLTLLRVRSLRQRRTDPDPGTRLREWRRCVIQFGVALLMPAFLLALKLHGGTFESGMRAFSYYFLGLFLALVMFTRLRVLRLPRFLAA